ncbi:MAG: hypothetical protein V1913_08160, partial [Fibrobacterota bacterium]
MPTGCWHDPYHIHFKDPATGKTDWKANVAHSVAYQDAALEYAGTVWKDVGIEPAWWREVQNQGDVEAYGFQQGNAHLFTVLRHDPTWTKRSGLYDAAKGPAPADVSLSADARKLGLAADQPIFVWEFKPRDPDKFPRRAGIQNLPDWDKLFTKRVCSVIPAGTVKDRLPLPVGQLEPELTRVLAVSQVPAVFCALEGRETNLLLPELLDCRIETDGGVSDKGYQLKVTSVYPAEVLLYVPPEMKTPAVSVNGKVVSGQPVNFGAAKFLRVSVPAGDSAVRMAL